MGVVHPCMAVLGAQRHRIAPGLHGQPGITARPAPDPGQQAHSQHQQSHQGIDQSRRKTLTLDQRQPLLQFNDRGALGVRLGTQCSHLGLQRTNALVVLRHRFRGCIERLPGCCRFLPLGGRSLGRHSPHVGRRPQGNRRFAQRIERLHDQTRSLWRWRRRSHPGSALFAFWGFARNHPGGARWRNAGRRPGGLRLAGCSGCSFSPLAGFGRCLRTAARGGRRHQTVCARARIMGHGRGNRRQLVDVHHAARHMRHGQVRQKNVGAGDFSRATSRHGHGNDGLAHRARYLHAHRRRASWQWWQWRYPHPGVAYRRVAKRHSRRNAGRRNICPRIGLHIEYEIDRRTQDDSPTALSQRDGCSTAGHHITPGPKNNVTYVHNNFLFWRTHFCIQVPWNTNAIMPP